MSWRPAIAAVVRERTGISLWAASDRAVQRFVHRRAAELKLADPQQYAGRLATEPPGGPECTRLISVVANCQTWFLRDRAQMEAAGDLLEARHGEVGRPLNVWSAGCSSGEEPYSLAIVAAERAVPVSVHASDVNADALELARRAHYGQWALRRVNQLRRARFFHQHDGTYAVVPAIRRTVHFTMASLTHGCAPAPGDPGGWDLIVCRNVLIYFDRALATRIVRQLVDALAPGGHLLLGAGEQSADPHLQPVMCRCRLSYQKSGAGGERALASPPIPTRPRPPPAAWQATEARLAELASTADAVVTNKIHREANALSAAYDGAAQAAKGGAFKRAAALLDQHLDDHPGDARGQLARGLVALRSHDLASALSAFEAAGGCDVLRADVHYFQAVALRKMGELERAAAALGRALFIDPTHWQASYLLANVAHRLGRLEQSRREFGRALEGLERAAEAGPRPSADEPGDEAAFRSGLTPEVSEAARICRVHLTASPPHRVRAPAARAN